MAANGSPMYIIQFTFFILKDIIFSLLTLLKYFFKPKFWNSNNNNNNSNTKKKTNKYKAYYLSSKYVLLSIVCFSGMAANGSNRLYMRTSF